MESSQGMSAGQDMMSSPDLAPAAVPSTSETANERSFRQSEVNDIVKKAKNDAIDTYRRQQVQQPEYLQQKYGDVAQAQNNAHSPSAPQNINNEESIRKIVAEETQRQRDAWQAENKQKSEAEQAQGIVNKFWNKISTGKDKYPDFEKVTGDIEFARFPNTVQLLAEHVDNASEILYELGKDRIKMANLESLSYMSPRDAIIQVQRLSQSIKDNESAGRVRLPNEPLSQMRPSVTGTDSGSLSMKDLRAKYRG